MAKTINIRATATIGEIAEASGSEVTEYDVKKHIRVNGIDHDFDIALDKYRTIQSIRKEYPDYTPAQISELLTKKLGKGYSRNTVVKYWRKEDEPSPIKYIGVSLLDAAQTKFAMATVSDEDRAILKIILQLYLQENPKFDCDLTFSKGDFYRQGVPYPRYCFDLNPEQPNDLKNAPKVYHLRDGDNIHSAENCLKDDTVSSMVIDLPQFISEDGKSSPEAFADIRDLAISYYSMLELAYQKLKPLSDIESGGVLVMKVGDLKFQDKWIWLTNIVTEIATGRRTRLSNLFYDEYTKVAKENGREVEEMFPTFDFELVDKFVHRYAPSDSSRILQKEKSSLKMHDYFLVFRKGKKVETFDTYYFSSSNKEPINSLTKDLWKNDYGPIVASRLSIFKDKTEKAAEHFNFEIAIPMKTNSNHINMSSLVPKIIVNRINDLIGDIIPNNKTFSGKIFLEHLNEILRQKLIKEKKVRYLLPQETIPYTIDILKKAGIKFLEEKLSKRNHFDDRIRILIDTDDLEINPI